MYYLDGTGLNITQGSLLLNEWKPIIIILWVGSKHTRLAGRDIPSGQLGQIIGQRIAQSLAVDTSTITLEELNIEAINFDSLYTRRHKKRRKSSVHSLDQTGPSEYSRRCKLIKVSVHMPRAKMSALSETPLVDLTFCLDESSTWNNNLSRTERPLWDQSNVCLYDQY